MSHTENRLETYWTEAQVFIQKIWPKFTSVELSHVNGNFDTFLVQLKRLYNDFPKNEAIARQKLQIFFNKMEELAFKESQKL
jgi:hypothetical protein